MAQSGSEHGEWSGRDSAREECSHVCFLVFPSEYRAHTEYGLLVSQGAVHYFILPDVIC